MHGKWGLHNCKIGPKYNNGGPKDGHDATKYGHYNINVVYVIKVGVLPIRIV